MVSLSNYQISNFMKILLVGSELSYAGGRRDMKISVAFHDFAKGSTNYNYLKGILVTVLHSPFL